MYGGRLDAISQLQKNATKDKATNIKRLTILGANTLIRAKPIVTNVLVLMILGQNLYKCFKSLKSIHWPIKNI